MPTCFTSARGTGVCLYGSCPGLRKCRFLLMSCWTFHGVVYQMERPCLTHCRIIVLDRGGLGACNALMRAWGMSFAHFSICATVTPSRGKTRKVRFLIANSSLAPFHFGSQYLWSGLRYSELIRTKRSMSSPY